LYKKIEIKKHENSLFRASFAGKKLTKEARKKTEDRKPVETTLACKTDVKRIPQQK